MRLKDQDKEEDVFSSFGEEVSQEEKEIEKLPESEKARFESLDPYWDVPLPVVQKKGISEQQRRRIELSKIREKIDQLLKSDPYFDIKSPLDEKELANISNEENEDVFSTFGGEISKEEIEKEELSEETKDKYQSSDSYWDVPSPIIKRREISQQQQERIQEAKKRDQINRQLDADPYFGIPSPFDENEPIDIDPDNEEEEIGVERLPSAKASPFQFAAISLTGRLHTSIDGSQLGEGDMQILKNLRYGRKSPKSISGMTKINSSIFYSG